MAWLRQQPARGRLWTLTTLAVLFGLALFARLPHFGDVPRLTDETAEAMLAFSIAQGRALPLTNVDSYIGPHLSYLLAALFAIFGPNPLLPRAVAMACGVLTVPVTGWLAMTAASDGYDPGASTLQAQLAGLVAGLMVALNPLLVVVNSHVGWSHAITPLFSTAGLLALLVGVKRRKGAWLAAAGLLLGLAVATHPTAALLVAGAAGYVLCRERWLLRTRWLWIAAGAFVLVNGPLLAYNLMTHGGSVANAQVVLSEYAGGQMRRATLLSYLRSLGRHGLLLEQIVAGPLDLRPPTLQTAADPLLLTYGVITVVALAAVLRRRRGLLVLLPGLGLFAGMAYLNTSKHEPVPDGRYLAPLIPLLATAVGSLAADLAASARPERLGLGAAALALVVAGHPALHGIAYLDRAAREHPSDAGMIEEAQRAAEFADPGEPIVLDSRLNNVAIRSRGANDEAFRFRTLRYVLTLARVPFVLAPVRLDAIRQPHSGTRLDTGRLVVLSTETLRGHTATSLRSFGLRDPAGRRLSLPRPEAGFAAYRVVASGHVAVDQLLRRPSRPAARGRPSRVPA